MSDTPAFLQDAKALLSAKGFATGNSWYHGTTSVLLDSILANGLKRSGDKAMKQAAKKTMATIGNSYTEQIEPVFLTQSKELAYYWAQQTVRNRSVRFEGEEQPVVLSITLPAELNENVKPDVGAATIAMVDGGKYLDYLDRLYQEAGLKGLEINPLQADRMDYLNKLGMAYYDRDIDAQYLSEVTAQNPSS